MGRGRGLAAATSLRHRDARVLGAGDRFRGACDQLRAAARVCRMTRVDAGRRPDWVACKNIALCESTVQLFGIWAYSPMRVFPVSSVVGSQSHLAVRHDTWMFPYAGCRCHYPLLTVYTINLTINIVKIVTTVRGSGTAEKSGYTPRAARSAAADLSQRGVSDALRHLRCHRLPRCAAGSRTAVGRSRRPGDGANARQARRCAVARDVDVVEGDVTDADTGAAGARRSASSLLPGALDAGRRFRRRRCARGLDRRRRR